MKKSLQFALPLLVPAVLLLGTPAFSQGNGQRGGRGGGNAPARQERSGGQDRGGSMNRGSGQSRGSQGNQNRTYGQQGRSPSMPSGTNRTYGQQGRTPNRPSGTSRTYGDRPGSQNRSPQMGNNGNSRNNGNRNYGSPSSPSPGTMRVPRPDQRDRVYNGVNRNNNRSYGSNRGTSYGSNRGTNYNHRGSGYSRYPGRTPGRSYAPPVRWGYRSPYRGQTFASLNFGYRTIPFGGFNYCYYGGIWYRPFGSYYRVIAPPIGISINILPFGYSRLSVGPSMYYYYGGTYYLPRNNGYVVVDPPLGAKLPALPSTAREAFINGQRLYEDDGTYYMEEYNVNNQRLYTVVGVHGVLDQGQIDQISGAGYSTSYDPGLLTVLPVNSRKVVISGQEYYLTPDEVYYQEITDGNTVSYQVVGM